MERNNAIWILELIRERESKTLAERDALNLAIKALEKQNEADFCNNNEVSRARTKAIEAIAQPEIIYCKDCKHGHKYDVPHSVAYSCDILECDRSGDQFCDWGQMEN